jgi:hypothetical protein
VFGTALAVWAMGLELRADQVEMQNGDRYVGKVVSLNGDALVLQSEVLGKVQLVRSKVTQISFGPIAAASRSGPLFATNVQGRVVTTPGGTNSELASLRQLGGNTNLIRQVQQQFLSDAGPEANEKFNELLGGLLSGKVTVTDLRAQAKAAADQVRGLRKELGEDAGPMLDGYLAILDKFVQEGAPGNAVRTNTPGWSAEPGPRARAEEE